MPPHSRRILFVSDLGFCAYKGCDCEMLAEHVDFSIIVLQVLLRKAIFENEAFGKFVNFHSLRIVEEEFVFLWAFFGYQCDNMSDCNLPSNVGM